MQDMRWIAKCKLASLTFIWHGSCKWGTAHAAKCVYHARNSYTIMIIIVIIAVAMHANSSHSPLGTL